MVDREKLRFALSRQFLLGIVVPPFVVLALNEVASYIYLYDRYPHIDVVMHLLGGAAIAWSWMTLHTALFSQVILPRWYRILVPVAIVALAAVSWEFYEFVFDWRDGAPIRQISIANTMQDLACGLIGGTLVATVRTRES